MIDIDLRALVGKLNDECRQALEAAAGLCLSKTHYEVDVEHYLLKLSERTDNDLAAIFRHFEVSPDRVTQDLMRSLDRLKTGNSRAPALSPRLPRMLRDAWILASVQFGYPHVRSGLILLALLADENTSRLLYELSRDLRSISAAALSADFATIVAASGEEEAASAGGDGARPTDERGIPRGGKTPALDAYTIDLTARAARGEIDPILGRDAEIRQMIDVLMRRRKNNPILTGEAGVGKTAVVEGLALRIAGDDTPPSLQNVAIHTLDLGLLQAGAGVKGEFENRLKQVIAEVKASPRPIILFIDEAHTLIGAGGQAGGSDAANLLKPALARGELRTIAATTWAEYKKYFEKDAALERRFQVVKVEEPSEDLAIVMMRGLTDTLERHHGVRVLDEAVEAAVHLSHRYITGRQLPDKSVDLLDTAAARVAIGNAATPPAIEDAQRRIDHLTTQIDILTREEATAGTHGERLAALAADRDAEQTRLEALRERWEKERTLTGEIRAIRDRLERADPPPSEEERAAARQDLARLMTELLGVQGEAPLMQVCVDRQAVSEVVSGWTGIPVGKMLRDEVQTVLDLQRALGERVVGQSHALEAVAQRIHTSRAGLDDPSHPVGVFLLVGPSGVGKTETGLALAETLYGGERNIITVNMSEYQEAHSVSRLKGSPPGYVGYGEGGVLTEAVRQRPYSIVLMDEVEKAHHDVLELFYQVFDKGTLEDGEGRIIDFKNTIILLTSNLGTDTLMKLCADPETRPSASALAQEIRPALLEFFAPALLGRMVVVPYYPLADDVMHSIVRLKLGKVGRRLGESHGMRLEYDDAVVEQIAARCTEVESGARNIDHIVTGTLLPDISRELLARLAEDRPATALSVFVDDGGNFGYTFS